MSVELCSSVSHLKSIPLTLQPSPITDPFPPSQASILFIRTSVITIPLEAFTGSLVSFMLPIPMVISANLMGLQKHSFPLTSRSLKLFTLLRRYHTLQSSPRGVSFAGIFFTTGTLMFAVLQDSVVGLLIVIYTLSLMSPLNVML